MNEQQKNPYAAPIVQTKKVKTRRKRVRRIVLRLLGVAFILVFARIVYGVFSEWSDARYIGDWLVLLAFVGFAFFVVYTLGDGEEGS